MESSLKMLIAGIVVASALLGIPTGVLAGNHDDVDYWRCPYTPDGACAPKRQTYGYFAPKWRRWPGVTSADYESKLPPADFSAPQGPTETGPRVTPDELLPPTDLPTLDDIPTPPRDDSKGPPPLTPESEQPQDTILEPPSEDIMEELLPEDEPGKPSTKPAKEPSKEPAEEPLIEPSEEPSTKPESKSDQPLEEKPFEDDPFKDDPLFNDGDDAPAPPGGAKRSGSEAVPRSLSPIMPAMRQIPTRLPAARVNHPVPASRLTRRSAPAERPAGSRPPRADLSLNSGAPRNPLRGEPTPDLVADDLIVPTAAWQAPEQVETAPEIGGRTNPLRN